MFTDVYIGKVKGIRADGSEFDFEKEGNYNGNMPPPAYEMERPWPTYPGERDLFWAVMDEPGAKRLDWGAWLCA